MKWLAAADPDDYSTWKENKAVLIAALVVGNLTL